MDELVERVLGAKAANVYVILPRYNLFTLFAHKLQSVDTEGTYLVARQKFQRSDGRMIHLVAAMDENRTRGMPEGTVFRL